jgi:hypothetical protein
MHAWRCKGSWFEGDLQKKNEHLVSIQSVFSAFKKKWWQERRSRLIKRFLPPTFPVRFQSWLFHALVGIWFDLNFCGKKIWLIWFLFAGDCWRETVCGRVARGTKWEQFCGSLEGEIEGFVKVFSTEIWDSCCWMMRVKDQVTYVFLITYAFE